MQIEAVWTNANINISTFSILIGRGSLTWRWLLYLCQLVGAGAVIIFDLKLIILSIFFLTAFLFLCFTQPLDERLCHLVDLLTQLLGHILLAHFLRPLQQYTLLQDVLLVQQLQANSVSHLQPQSHSKLSYL